MRLATGKIAASLARRLVARLLPLRFLPPRFPLARFPLSRFPIARSLIAKVPLAGSLLAGSLPIGPLLGGALMVGLLLAGCQRPSEGIFLELTGRIFVFNYRVATANYLLTFKKVSAIPAGSSIEVLFDNPRGGDRLITRQAVFAADETVAISSPHLSCVKKDHAYAVDVRLVDGQGKQLQEIATSVTSDVDQSVMLPSKPLVVGPVYTPNPDVFKADGTTDFSGEADCPM